MPGTLKTSKGVLGEGAGAARAPGEGGLLAQNDALRDGRHRHGRFRVVVPADDNFVDVVGDALDEALELSKAEAGPEFAHAFADERVGLPACA